RGPPPRRLSLGRSLGSAGRTCHHLPWSTLSRLSAAPQRSDLAGGPAAREDRRRFGPGGTVRADLRLRQAARNGLGPAPLRAHWVVVRGQTSQVGGRASRRARGQKGSAGASPSRIRTLPGAAGVRERSMTEREFAIDVVRRLRDAGFEA